MKVEIDTEETLTVKRAAVLGAGVMGGQIAALLANAGVEVHLLDQTDTLAGQGLELALKSRPPAFYIPELAQRITTGSFDDFSCLAQVDWVVEAVVEAIGAKQALLKSVDTCVGPKTIVSSNTSGLSIEGLSQVLSPALRQRFLGVHFFNPPRYMKLVEVIPAKHTAAQIVDQIEQYLQAELGKGVVRCKDTPNFIANRLGVFVLLDALRRMEQAGLTPELVDGLTGPLLGRPRSGTLRLCDMIGLDVLSHVAATARRQLPDEGDLFQLPPFLERMVAKGLVGAKAGGGFYRKTEEGIAALDLKRLEYRPLQKVDLGPLDEGGADLATRLERIWQSSEANGTWVRQHLMAVFGYAANRAQAMADGVGQIDRALRWGFNWQAGPFEMMDLVGPQRLRAAFDAQAVPPVLVTGQNFYQTNEKGRKALVFSPKGYSQEPGASGWWDRLNPDKARFGNKGAYVVELAAGIGALVFQGKMNVLGPPALEVVHRVVEEAPFDGLVLCGSGALFSAGADIRHLVELVRARDWDGLDRFLQAFQNGALALRYAPFPVVAAVRGLALGGGCEFCLAADAQVAAAESQMGLVEAKVGVIPGGGGCKELVRRLGAKAPQAFAPVFSGLFSTSAHQAQRWGFVGGSDTITLSEDLLLQRAVAKVGSLLEQGYKKPEAAPMPAAGGRGMAALEQQLETQLAQGRITPHDREVGITLARVLCGGPSDLVEETELLALERTGFLHLCGMAPTQERLEHMLAQGKPLKN